MNKLSRKLAYTGAGMSCGLAGLNLMPNCGGPACASCFGCVGLGVGILAMVLFHKIREGKKENKRDC